MTSTDPRAIVQRYVTEVITGRSRTAVDELIGSPMLAGHIKENMATLEAVISDLQIVVDAVVGEGDTVAVFYTLHGKHAGEFPTPWITVPATGRDVMIPFASRFRVEGEKIASLATVSELFRMLAQITTEEPTQ